MEVHHTVSLNACDIILADPHFWGFDGAIRMSQLLNSWGLTWGVHSNNHLNLLDDTPQIIGGKLQVPDAPGLGVHLNMERVMEANRLYNSLPSHDRDDAKAMQYLIPNWVYDHKKPCLVR